MIAGVAASLAAGIVLLNASPEPTIRSLAVTPIVNLSRDSADEAFADGLHETLILELGRYSELEVTARTSVTRFKRTTVSPQQIARELNGVDGIVEATMQRVGTRIRVIATLVHAQSGRRLWGNSYDREARDALLLQSELAAEIARAVRINAAPKERTPRVASGPLDSMPREIELRRLYNSGRAFEATRSLTGMQTAMAKYRQAIARDSQFAPAYAGLSIAYTLLGTYAYAPLRVTRDSARLLAERAVDLDPMDSETRTALAVSLGDRGRFEAAEREFRTAIDLNASDARARYWYGHLLVALGRAREALDQIERTAKLDPHAPRGVQAMRIYSTFMLTGRRPHVDQPAATIWGPVLEAEPGEPWARRSYALLLAKQGDCGRARAEHRIANSHAPDNSQMLASEGLVSLFCGDHRAARTTLDSLKRRAEARAGGLWIGVLHAQLGEADSAFAWLETAEWTIASRTDLRALRWLDPLRADERYAPLVRRVAEPQLR